MDLKAGQSASFHVRISEEEFHQLAALSGDWNPIYTDRDVSAGARYGQPAAPPMLLYSLISRGLSQRLPGPGTCQISQMLLFPTPVFSGEEVLVRLEMASQLSSGVVKISSAIVRPNGEIGCEADSVVYLEGGHTSQPAYYPGPDEIILTSAPSWSEQKTFRGLRIGQQASMKRVFTTADIEQYIEISKDDNPLYTNNVYAQNAGFHGNLLPSVLVASLFYTLLGLECPGPGTAILRQQLVFSRPCYPGEKLNASVEIRRLMPDQDLALLRTICTSRGEVTCNGEVLVSLRDR